MNEFNRSNKVTGTQRINVPIRKLNMKVRIKQQYGIALPHFEDIINKSAAATSCLNDAENIDEYSFKWQEKVFAAWELNRYSNVENCITETELEYHRKINNESLKPSKVFTYIQEDNYLTSSLRSAQRRKSSFLNRFMECLDLNRQTQDLNEDSISMRYLFRSQENIDMEEEICVSMHIALDNSEYAEDGQLLLKQEVILVTIQYNPQQQCLVVSPDVNDLEWNPYTVETSSGATWNYQYSVELSFEGEEEDDEELSLMLKKLLKKCQDKKKYILHFAMPPLRKKHYFVNLEIVSAAGFETEDLCVEFYLKFPEGVESNNVHHGRTHVAGRLAGGSGDEWCFGHHIELSLEAASGSEVLPIQLFLEAISVDWWGRYRTEGYSYLLLPLNPGAGSKELICMRPEEKDLVKAESRRFFVGGCHLIKDLEVLMVPQSQNTNFNFISTGSISVRWNTLLQSNACLSSSPSKYHGSSASALLRGAEAALRQYRRARDRLAAATKDLDHGPYEEVSDS